MQNLLEVVDVTKSFGSIKALQKVSLTLKAGHVHAVVGENGAGKSTLMKVISGVHRPTSGAVRVNGRDVHWRSVEDAQADGVSTIFQEFILLPNLSVAENLFLGRELRNRWGGLERRKMREESHTIMKRFDLDIDPERLTSTLSVAEQQMVEIAKGIMRKADIFVFDEPTAALGDHESERLFEIIRDLREAGKGILYVSHRLPEIFDLSDEVTVLKDACFAGHYKTSELTPESLVTEMVGRPLADLFPPRGKLAAEADSEAIALENIRVNGMSGTCNFSLKRHEILGLAGLEGQGQVEITRGIFGDHVFEAGTIRLDGRPVHFHRPQDAIASEIGLIPEDRKAEGLFLDLGVQENIVAGNLPGVPLWRFAPRDGAAVRAQVEALRIRLNSLRQQIKNLSGGNQQKALLARWLVRGVGVLICEEPTRGVDVGAKAEIYRLLRGLADSGVPVLVTSRELPELLGLCDRILVLRDGGTVGEFAAEGTTEADIMHAAIYGDAA